MIGFQEQLQLYANYFYNLGLNVSCIDGIGSYEETINKNYLKCPYHKWHHLITERQSLTELQAYNWNKAVGIGFILGYNDVRCLDFDGVKDYDLIKVSLKTLGLPVDYEWVSLTGSCNGFHIFIRTTEHNIKNSDNRTKAFAPFGFYDQIFERLELRWKNHVVVPPSSHLSSRNYKFWNKELPTDKIKNVPIEKVYNLIGMLCTDNRSYYEDSNEETFVKLCSRYYSIDSESNILCTKASEDMLDYVYKSGNNDIHRQDIDLLPYLTSSENLLNFIDSKDVYKEGGIFKVIDNEDWLQEHFLEVDSTYYLVIDTETTGLNTDRNSDNCARMVQIAWIAYNLYGAVIEEKNYLIKPNGFTIPENAVRVHHITNSIASQFGVEIESVLNELNIRLRNTVYIIGHNIDYDIDIIENEYWINGVESFAKEPTRICTMKSSTDYCKLAGYNGYKYPTLSELNNKLFSTYIKESHNAMDDVRVTANCYWELKALELVKS